jgi:hypothetical protein
VRTMKESNRDIVGIASILLAVLNGIILVASVGASLMVRQRFADIFADFNAELPTATVIFLSIPWIVWLAVVVVVLAVLVAKEFITRKWIPLWLNLLFIGLAVGYWAVFVVVMMVPLIHLTQQLK